MSASPPLEGSGLSDDEDVLDPLIRQLGDLDDIDLEIDTKMFDDSTSSFNFSEAAQNHVAASVAVGTTLAASAAASGMTREGPAVASAATSVPAAASAPMPAPAPPPPPPAQAAAPPAEDPMAAQRAALYPPPEQPPRKLDWGDGNGSGGGSAAAPKRKSGSQYEIAPVVRRRHSKEEWSSEIDAGDGTRPKRRNSGDARNADWHLRNNMFGDGSGGGGGAYSSQNQHQQYGGQYQSQQGQQGHHGQYQHQHYQQQQQLPKRRHSDDARSANWAMKNNMFDDRGGPGYGPGGGSHPHPQQDYHHPQYQHRSGGPYGGGYGGEPDRPHFTERRRCNSDSRLNQQWDFFDNNDDSDDDFGPDHDEEIERRRSMGHLRNAEWGPRHDPDPYQRRERSNSANATSGITPEWAFGHDSGGDFGHHGGDSRDGRGGSFGAPHMEAPAPAPFLSNQQHQYRHQGAPPPKFHANMYPDRPPDFSTARTAGGKMRRRYSDSRLKRWDADDVFGSSDDDSAVGSEPIQPDDIFGAGGGTGGYNGGGWQKKKPISTRSTVSDSALDAVPANDDTFGEPTPIQRAAAEQFHQYGNDGRDHAQLFTSGIPAYKNDQKVAAPTGMDQSGQNGSDDATHRKIAEMKEQIALLQSSMAALESTVQPRRQAPQAEQDPQNPPPTTDPSHVPTMGTSQGGPPPTPAPAAPVAPEAPPAVTNNGVASAGNGMSTFEAAAVNNDDDDDDDDDFGDDDDDDFGEEPDEGPGDQITKLNDLMSKSQKSLKQLQEYDKSQGLPASHCATMVKSNRSRQQLLEGRILKKWDGTPMIEFDESGRVISEEEKRKAKREETKKKKQQEQQARFLAAQQAKAPAAAAAGAEQSK